MHNKPKLRRYITFKTTLIFSSDVKQFISKPRKSLLNKLITGILPIVFETGRYKRIRDPVTKTFRSLQVEERLCNMCDLSETEDEIHFVFINNYVPYMTILEQRFFKLWLKTITIFYNWIMLTNFYF